MSFWFICFLDFYPTSTSGIMLSPPSLDWSERLPTELLWLKASGCWSIGCHKLQYFFQQQFFGSHVLVFNWPYDLSFIHIAAFVSFETSLSEDPSIGCPFLLKCLPSVTRRALNAGCFIITHWRRMRLLLTEASFLYGRWRVWSRECCL